MQIYHYIFGILKFSIIFLYALHIFNIIDYKPHIEVLLEDTFKLFIGILAIYIFYPFRDKIIISFEDKKLANILVEKLIENQISTKNVPDAIEWHFAKYWNHMLKELQMSKKELNKYLNPSSEIIERSVALPIMVNVDFIKIKEQAQKIRDLVQSVINNKID